MIARLSRDHSIHGPSLVHSKHSILLLPILFLNVCTFSDFLPWLWLPVASSPRHRAWWSPSVSNSSAGMLFLPRYTISVVRANSHIRLQVKNVHITRLNSPKKPTNFPERQYISTSKNLGNVSISQFFIGSSFTRQCHVLPSQQWGEEGGLQVFCFLCCFSFVLKNGRSNPGPLMCYGNVLIPSIEIRKQAPRC